MSQEPRRLGAGNRLKLGFFGANCSSGRFVTTIPERWHPDWERLLTFVRLADDAGIDFVLPIARWKGYGGETDFQGETLETITWATGVLAHTRRIVAFGTVHVPLFHPLVAAKQAVTADLLGQGRFGLNVVCGWNEGEFAMFGVGERDHAARYAQGDEWLTVVKLAWDGPDDADFMGEFYRLQGIRAKPKPFGDRRPLIMNAGASGPGRAFALRHSDAFFTAVPPALDRTTVAAAAATAAQIRADAAALGRTIEIYTTGVLICRPTRAEALAQLEYVVEAHADLAAVANIRALRGAPEPPDNERERVLKNFASGNGGLLVVGDPDEAATTLNAISDAGFDGVALSLVDYASEMPYIADALLPRLVARGLRSR